MVSTALPSTSLLLNPCHIPQERQNDQTGGHQAKEGKASMVGVRVQTHSTSLTNPQGGGGRGQLSPLLKVRKDWK